MNENPWTIQTFHPAPPGWRVLYPSPHEADERAPVEVPMPGWVSQQNTRTGARRTVPAIHGPTTEIVAADYDPEFPVTTVLGPGEPVTDFERMIANLDR